MSRMAVKTSKRYPHISRRVRDTLARLLVYSTILYSCKQLYQAMPPKRGFFCTLIPGPNPYLPMAFGYRQGIPNPYSLRSHHTRLPVFQPDLQNWIWKFSMKNATKNKSEMNYWKSLWKINDRPRWFEYKFPIAGADILFYSVFQ